MSDPVTQALTALKEVILTAAVPVEDGEPVTLTGAWVFPEEFAEMPQTPTCPAATVFQVTNRYDDVLQHTKGQVRHEWVAGVLLFLAPGQLRQMNAQSAAAELAVRGWAQAIWSVLAVNASLKGTAQAIGQQTALGRRLFRPRTGHIHWATAPYWGMRLEIPVAQVVTQQMRAQ